MDADTRAIYDELCRVARNGGTTYYSKIAPLIGLSHRSPRISHILESISRYEHLANKPLLSAVVVRKGKGGQGLASTR